MKGEKIKGLQRNESLLNSTNKSMSGFQDSFSDLKSSSPNKQNLKRSSLIKQEQSKIINSSSTNKNKTNNNNNLRDKKQSLSMKKEFRSKKSSVKNNAKSAKS